MSILYDWEIEGWIDTLDDEFFVLMEYRSDFKREFKDKEQFLAWYNSKVSIKPLKWVGDVPQIPGLYIARPKLDFPSFGKYLKIPMVVNISKEDLEMDGNYIFPNACHYEWYGPLPE
jgi:hypothetical protein